MLKLMDKDISRPRRCGRIIMLMALALLVGQFFAAFSTLHADPNVPLPVPTLTDPVIAPPVPTIEPSTPAKSARAVVIPIDKMIDEGLYQSLKRRTQAALDEGADYIIYRVDTFGGRLDSAIQIWEYFIQYVKPRAHTVAYIPTKAISAGILISVACEDIVMKRATLLGDSAPVSGTGQKIEGVEREKIESPTRGYFASAAKENGYPIPLCEAMVTMTHKVYRVENRKTGAQEFFESDDLPKDPCAWDLDNMKLIVNDDELLTVTADEALEYGISRATVEDFANDYEEVLDFFEQRDNVVFTRPVSVAQSNWSEELARWLASPVVTGILTMIALLGIYVELNTPGLGLPGGVAVVALAILFGSKFLVGMANWWEIAVFLVGVALLLVEVFVIPGFGIAGVTGLLLILFGLGAMMIANPPEKLPIPTTDYDWQMFEQQFIATAIGIILFAIAAYFIGRYLPKIPLANRLILAPAVNPPQVRSGGTPRPSVTPPPVKPGDRGVSLSPLRPSGNARINNKRLTVVTRGELIEPDQPITVVTVEGNRIVVRQA